MRASTFQGLNHQARLQLHHRRTGEHRIEHLPEEPDRGFALLPEPSPGDVWLDLEGDPWFEPARGLEYLFGWVELGEDGAPRYEHIWSRDREAEKQGFERLVDHIVERRRRFPGMHVYHYAPYERTALSRLMGQHGTREEEIDDLLRGEVLVDLFRVTKQALRASVPSYSIKEVEKLFGFERTADVGGGGESVTAFETWLETEDDSLLDGIRDYNEEDCVSLYELHRWLLERRPAEMPWRLPPDERERSEEAEERDAERARVRDALLAGAEEGDPDWLLAHLLDYHQREERPQWWEYFFHRGLDDEELVTNRNTLGGLVPDGEPYKVEAVLVVPVHASRRRSTGSTGAASTPRPSAGSTWTWTTSTGRSSSAGAASRPTSRSRPRSCRRCRWSRRRSGRRSSASPRTGSGIRPRSRSSSGARRGRGWTGR